ncbi:MAG: hypothetical protein J6X22_02870 [Muribaculaceae bacterium]|nr:hypothetical protein [Muribaculaceae bacterium]
MASLIFLSLLLMMSVTSIPRSAIKDNAVSVITQIHDEGPYPIVHNPILLLDNYTDCVMCNVILSCDSSYSLFQKSLLNPVQISNKGKVIEDTYLWAIGEKDISRKSYYGRYWHGYQVPLTLLLLVTDYNGIRLFNGILYLFLFVCALWLMYKRCGWQLSIAFLVANLITASPFIAPMSMQFFGCHAIMLIATTVVLLRNQSNYKGSIIFITIGACTAFIDLLTTPIITLGVPLACFIVYNQPKRKMRTISLMSLAWVIGYVTLWASKWVIATIITGENVIANALGTAQFRTIGNGSYFDAMKPIGSILSMLGKYNITSSKVIVSAIIIIAILAMIFIIRRGWKPLKQQLWWLILGALPLVWYCLLPQHSIAHFFFTWRALLVTVFSLTAMILYSITLSRNE